MINRFLPGYTDNDAKLIMEDIINKNYNTIINQITDSLHYYSKISTPITSNSINYITKKLSWFK
jgi:hypothetical protein